MKELRIGVVLYGGVSLAVYMNGVATELWYLLRASRCRAEPAERALAEREPDAGGDRQVATYIALLDSFAARPGGQALRVVVDTIAGASAGGVNGAVLAKAIVEGADAQVLNRVWIDDADIARLQEEPAVKAPWHRMLLLGFGACLFGPLRRIKRRVDQRGSPSWLWMQDHFHALTSGKAQGRSPLSGDYFCSMIARSLAEMGERRHASLLPDTSSFDLFLTATDFHGWPRHLPVDRRFHPQPLYERAHAQVFHFGVEPKGESGVEPKGKRRLDDFDLTFATRATAGFPGAFAPLTYAAALRGFARDRSAAQEGGEASAAGDSSKPGTPDHQARFHRRMLAEQALFGFPCGSVRMIDGGVLNNKPFSHVVSAIEGKAAKREVYRCVLYVEPDPQPMPEPAADRDPGLGELGGGLFALFRHEPIVEDLQRLQERNAKVDYVCRCLELARAAAETAAEQAGKSREPPLDWPPRREQLEAWRPVVNGFSAAQAASGYDAYMELKVRCSLAFMAEMLCRRLHFPRPSRQAFVVRRLVNAWAVERARLLADPQGWMAATAMPPVRRFRRRWVAFLSQCDLPFRERRLWFLVATANRLYDDFPEARDEIDRFKRALAQALDATRRRLDALPTTTAEACDEGADSWAALGEAVAALEPAALEALIAGLEEDPAGALAQSRKELQDSRNGLYRQLAKSGKDLNAAILDAVRTLPEGPQQEMAKAFAVFPFVDAAVFPVMDAAGIAVPLPVRVMRISPDDSRSFATLPGGRPALASAPLGAFAGFLSREAREHDLLWGRLDGIERLVELLAAASGGDPQDEPVAALRRALMLQALDDHRDLEHLKPLIAQLRAALGAGAAV